GLDLEPSDGDVYYAASELRLSRGGDYLAWVEGAAALELRLDGAVVLSRAPYPREMPRSQTVAVKLAPGTHHALVRCTRAAGARRDRRGASALARGGGPGRGPHRFRRSGLAPACTGGPPGPRGA